MVNGQGPRVQAAQLAAVPLTGRITLAEGQKNEREQRLVRVRKTKGSSQTFGQQRDKET